MIFGGDHPELPVPGNHIIVSFGRKQLPAIVSNCFMMDFFWIIKESINMNGTFCKCKSSKHVIINIFLFLQVVQTPEALVGGDTPDDLEIGCFINYFKPYKTSWRSEDKTFFVPCNEILRIIKSPQTTGSGRRTLYTFSDMDSIQ